MLCGHEAGRHVLARRSRWLHNRHCRRRVHANGIRRVVSLGAAPRAASHRQQREAPRVVTFWIAMAGLGRALRIVGPLGFFPVVALALGSAVGSADYAPEPLTVRLVSSTVGNTAFTYLDAESAT